MDRPKITRQEVIDLLLKGGVDVAVCKVAVLGIRGYRKNSMGKAGVNDRAIYDDAFAFVDASGAFYTWNGNTDPSIYRTGVAVLVPGRYTAVSWMHKGRYQAFQIIADVVKRDGQAGVDKGRHGINFHYGRPSNTDSLGCQTMLKSDFTDANKGFQPTVRKSMRLFGVKSFEYLLVEA